MLLLSVGFLKHLIISAVVAIVLAAKEWLYATRIWLNNQSSEDSSNNIQSKGYKGSDDEHRVKDVWLEGEESQAHVGEDEVLCQEVQQLKQLMGKRQANILTM